LSKEFLSINHRNKSIVYSNAAAGAIFVFGKTYEDHFYVFKVTSIIIFLGSVINVLYYLGAMQYVIGKIAWIMQKCLNTTAAEVCIECFFFIRK
jgi:nucleoside permease NupC